MIITFTPLENSEMMWHINTAFNCVEVDVVGFINMILLNSAYL